MISREQMFFKDYVWTTTSGDNPNLKQRDRDFISKIEGYEVRPYLTQILEYLNAELTVANFNKAEIALRSHHLKHVSSRTILTFELLKELSKDVSKLNTLH